MKSTLRLLPVITILFAVGCSSSDSSISNNSDSNISNVDLSFSDAAVDGATEVVITVDRIIFQRSENGGADDIIIDQFTADSMEADAATDSEKSNNDATDSSTTGAGTYTIDLLTVQGPESRLVVEDVDLPVGDYTNMLIEVIDEDLTRSYVTDANGVKPLKVPSQKLKLGSFTIKPTSTQSMVVEFGLQQSMTYNPGPDRYILKPRGVRIVSVDEAALIDGTINHAALQASEQCEALELGGTAGTIYLYEGHLLDSSALVDNADLASLNNAENKIVPIASSSMQSDQYALSYLEPGNYTLAVACHSATDDADSLDNISIPNPVAQMIEITLSEREWISCDVPLQEEFCATNEQSAQPQ